jgi:hypothetical protein
MDEIVYSLCLAVYAIIDWSLSSRLDSILRRDVHHTDLRTGALLQAAWRRYGTPWPPARAGVDTKY